MSQAASQPYFTVLATPRSVDALDSAIESAARQDFQDFEAIFIDDGTIERLPVILARELRNARIVRPEQDRTVAESLNRAVASATGRYLAFLESGDVWHPRYLSYQNAVFDSMPDALYSRVGYCTRGLQGDGFLPAILEPADAPDPVLEILGSADLPTLSCFAVSRSLLLRTGAFDPRAGSLLRTDLEIRLLGGLRSGGRLSCEEHPAPRVPQILVLKRLAQEVEDIGDALNRWSADLPAFLDNLYNRPFMERFRTYRGWFEARLIEQHCAALRSIEASLQIAA